MRWWAWGVAVIVIVSLVTYWRLELQEISRTAAIRTQDITEERNEAFKEYLQRQKDGYTLITLAKRLNSDGNEQLVEQLVLRAHELEPQSRDIAVLAAQYRPELKETVKKIDPLYGTKKPDRQ